MFEGFFALESKICSKKSIKIISQRSIEMNGENTETEQKA